MTNEPVTKRPKLSPEPSLSRPLRNDVFAVAVDVETHDWRKSYRGREDFVGRVVQLGYVVLDEDGREIHSQCNILRPEGFVVSRKAADYHGVSHARAVAEGVDADSALAFFVSWVRRIPLDRGFLVAHNMKHEDCALGNALSKHRKEDDGDALLNEWDRTRKCDTLSTRLLGLVRPKYRFRTYGLKLTATHELLCGSSKDMVDLRKNAHDALSDARMCGQIFMEYRKRFPKVRLDWVRPR